MPKESQRRPEAGNDEFMHEDDFIPRASEDAVLDETVRLARDGRKQLESDPWEHKPESD